MASYNDHDARNIAWVMGRAFDRDHRLNEEETHAKYEAEMECEFGPQWWLRAHP